MYEAGQILNDRYQLQQRLGHTAASRQTWLAQDLASATAESVILKLLAFGPQVEWQELELFEREAKILRALDHPGIPRYRDYFTLDRTDHNPLPWFVLVQDYIAGQTLKDLLSQGKHFSDRQVRQIATSLMDLLIYLHELSPPVLHRDIKPSNVIWSKEHRICLIDFGAVQDRAAAEGVTFTVVGTYGYAPMEQFGGRAVAASDLYALGATLIHLLTGVPPADLPQRDLRIQFADRVSLDPTFVQWITQLTDPDVSKRFQSARQALKALESPSPQQPAAATQRQAAPAPRPGSLTQAQRQASMRGRAAELLTMGNLTPPFNNGLQVHQTCDRLLITIPGLSLWQSLSIGILTGIALIFVGPIFLPLFGVASGQVFSYSLPIILLAAGCLYWGYLPVYIEFKRDQFLIYKFPANALVTMVSGRTSEIQDIFHTLKTFQAGKTSQEKRVMVIQTYGGEECFGKGLSWDECVWLVRVIQDWLNCL